MFIKEEEEKKKKAEKNSRENKKKKKKKKLITRTLSSNFPTDTINNKTTTPPTPTDLFLNEVEVVVGVFPLSLSLSPLFGFRSLRYEYF